ncbi:MAG: peroxiredoxin family protein, partial [Saprospiraceae bacterium]|nr:peroxiredoxin family protein [Saprospiraceae bacterium]
MKRYAGTLLGLLLSTHLWAQLPDGSIAPDFNLIDINGKQHHLYSYLSQGKTVILNFTEAWCQECWNYHQAGALQDFYTLYGPGGTDEATVVFIESDPVLGLDDLMGITSATAGDWISGTPFGIIDDTAANNEFMPLAKPTIYGIYPDKTTTILGRLTTDEIYEYVLAFDGMVNLVDTIIKVNL